MAGRQLSISKLLQNAILAGPPVWVCFYFPLTVINGFHFLLMPEICCPDCPFPNSPNNSTEPHVAPDSECNEANWSSGSAFYTVIALCFGYYSQPRGGLVAAGSGRTWRLSPILAGHEIIVFTILFTYAKLKGYSFVVACHAILAIRLANGFHSTELKEILGLEMDPPPPEVHYLAWQSEASAPDTNKTDPPEASWGYLLIICLHGIFFVVARARLSNP